MKLFLASIVVLISCNSDDTPKSPAAKQKPVVIEQEAPVLTDSTYSIRVGSVLLSLRQWDTSFNMQLLGKPLNEKTVQLDANSDTHAGSFIKTLEVEGLRLRFFSPKQNGRSFWVQEMILTDKKFRTAHNVGLGDSFEKVKKAYPQLQPFPGENKNMFYVADAGYEKSIEMEFGDDNRLRKLRMYYMIN